MPFTSINTVALSDLVYHEIDPAVGYARKDIVVQAEDPLKMGVVVFRTKSANDLAPYTPIESASDLALTNEFAIVFGDNYGCKAEWVVEDDAAAVNSVAIVGGPVFVKDALVIANNPTLNAAGMAALRQVLQNQGIVLEKTL